VRSIELSMTDEVKNVAPRADGDRVRGQPRRSHPVTRFYWACLREMGDITKELPDRSEPPMAANAWLQILKQRSEVVMGEPTFTHPEVADTVKFFGGWEEMWEEFNKLQMPAPRNRFTAAYREVLGER
jgi:hypothetical protein